jgi:predicted porin
MHTRNFALATLSLLAASAHAQNVVTVYGKADPVVIPFERPPEVRVHSAFSVGSRYALDYRTLIEVADPFRGGLNPRVIDDNLLVERFLERDSAYRPNRVWGMSVGFERGPFTLRAAHQNRNVTNTSTWTHYGNSYDARNSIIAANLDIGGPKVYAAYSYTKGPGYAPLWNPDNPYSAGLFTTPSMRSRDTMFGLAVPRGATTYLVSYIRKDDRDLANRDATQFAVGASYSLARRTDVYAAVSRIQNRNGAPTVAAHPGTKAINIGLRHSF